MRALVLSPAQSDLAEAIAYYESKEVGLGDDFAAQFYRTLDKILRYPGMGTRFTRRTRRCRMSRFPFGVLYAVRGEVILVGAVMDLRRGPTAWHERVRDL
jgi:plasmid stabilization system protein ParE